MDLSSACGTANMCSRTFDSGFLNYPCLSLPSSSIFWRCPLLPSHYPSMWRPIIRVSPYGIWIWFLSSGAALIRRPIVYHNPCESELNRLPQPPYDVLYSIIIRMDLSSII